MNYTMTDLRGHLFQVIENLKDPDAKTKMDAKTATAVCLAAKRLIETAHVELQFREQTGVDLAPSTFLGLTRVKGRGRQRVLESA